jgi:kynurenine formamidase
VRRETKQWARLAAVAGVGIAIGAYVVPGTAGAGHEDEGLALDLAAGSPVVHLSHPLGPDAPVFPGDPSFEAEVVHHVPDHGYLLEHVMMGTHTGTHVSAPCHFVEGAPCVDDLRASAFVLPAVVIDVRERAEGDPDFQVGIEELEAFAAAADDGIPHGALVILFTGWQARYGTPAYFDPAPGFAADAVEWMIAEWGIGGLGSDTFGPDATSDEDFSASTAIYESGGITVENMASLDQLPPVGDLVVAAPGRLRDGSGFPAAPIGILR